MVCPCKRFGKLVSILYIRIHILNSQLMNSKSGNCACKRSFEEEWKNLLEINNCKSFFLNSNGYFNVLVAFFKNPKKVKSDMIPFISCSSFKSKF